MDFDLITRTALKSRAKVLLKNINKNAIIVKRLDMREISIYKMKPVYIAGEVYNITALEEKLVADKEILLQIEQDYNRNQDEFKCEYITAKKNHLSNLHFYYWLILKKYFEDALLSEMPSFPDYQKEEMRKRGWMFPQAFINSRITTSGNVDVTTEELYTRNFDRLFDNLFAFTIGEPNSRIDRYYKQAIKNYKDKCYYSCAVSLFPIIESYHQYITSFNDNSFYRIKENLDSVEEEMESVNQIYSIKIKYYINLVKQFNELAKEHYFSVSLDRTNEPAIINRNRIMHGLFSREISQKDCLQLFCTLSNMVVIKTILEANDMMNRTAAELNELNQIDIH